MHAEELGSIGRRARLAMQAGDRTKAVAIIREMGRAAELAPLLACMRETYGMVASVGGEAAAEAKELLGLLGEAFPGD